MPEEIAPGSVPGCKSITTYLAGVMYEGRHLAARRLSLSDEVRLRRDPANTEDPNAIIVETRDGRQLGFIRRELAAFLASRLDASAKPIAEPSDESINKQSTASAAEPSDKSVAEPIAVRLTELSSDATGSAYRIGVCLSIPEDWLNPAKRSEDVSPASGGEHIRPPAGSDAINPQRIEYYYDESGPNPYVLLNCTDERFGEIRERMNDEGLVCVRHGLCYRPAGNGRPYQWYIRVDRTTELGRPLIEDFFKNKFDIAPEYELADALEDAKKRLDEQQRILEQQLSDYRTRVREYESRIGELDANSKREKETLERDISRKQVELEALKLEIREVGHENRQIKYEMRGRKSAAAPRPEVGTYDDPPDTVGDVLREFVSESLTPRQSLLVVGGLFPRHLVVLESAQKSAAGSEGFKHRKLLFELLWKLATEYWFTLAQGKGDAEARKAFGEHYAATESETVEGNERARRLRTFDYNGKKIPMMKHLKIGAKPGPFESIRVHFEWQHGERKIIIGYCGRHLPQG
jgi:hypothetical protein